MSLIEIKNGNTLLTTINNVNGEVKLNTSNTYMNQDIQVSLDMPVYDGSVINDYLCFTAEENNSTIQLYINTQYGPVPNPPTLEYSKDLLNWLPFVVGETVVAMNIGEKMYLRGDNPYFSPPETNAGNVMFMMTGKIAASGDLISLLDKSCQKTDISTQYCFSGAFLNCTALTSLPKLTATSLSYGCYYWMFYGCSNIKVSTVQTGEYQTPYRIPASGTGTAEQRALYEMFSGTGGTFTNTPVINTTYYTNNNVI